MGAERPSRVVLSWAENPGVWAHAAGVWHATSPGTFPLSKGLAQLSALLTALAWVSVGLSREGTSQGSA